MKLLLLVAAFLLISTATIPMSSSASPATFTVTFEEKGLPYGMNWTVGENGHSYTSTGNIVFYEPNGSYIFTVSPISGYKANKYFFDVNVTGSNLTEIVYWGAVYYPVTFKESGLNPGMTWNVTVAGQTLSSSTSAITFELTNGSYLYSVSPVNGSLSSPHSGTIDVNGTPVTLLLYFRIGVNMTFIVTGLPQGSYWSITLGNATYGSTSPIIYVDVANGSYLYQVHLPFNYYATHPSGRVSGNKIVYVDANSYILWEVLIALIVVVDAFLIIRIRRSRRASRKQQQQ